MKNSVLLTRSVMLGAILVGSGNAAMALTVTRCNAGSGGVFTTVLEVENDGVVTTYKVGEDGLTRSIAFDADTAIAWASAKFGGADANDGDCAAARGRDFDLAPDEGGNGSGSGGSGSGGSGSGGSGSGGSGSGGAPLQ